MDGKQMRIASEICLWMIIPIAYRFIQGCALLKVVCRIGFCRAAVIIARSNSMVRQGKFETRRMYI